MDDDCLMFDVRYSMVDVGCLVMICEIQNELSCCGKANRSAHSHGETNVLPMTFLDYDFYIEDLETLAKGDVKQKFQSIISLMCQ